MSTTPFTDTLRLTVHTGLSAGLQVSRSEPFRIGRQSDCAVRLLDDVVSRHHAELFLDKGQWWIKDLNSANGVIVNGQRVSVAALTGRGSFQLGPGGPECSFMINTAAAAKSDETMPGSPVPKMPPPAKLDHGREPDLDHYKRHYFSEKDGQSAGEHTIMVRRAFAAVQQKQRRIYFAIIGLVVVLLIATGAVALYQHRQVAGQRKLAEVVFYNLRALEIELIKLRSEFEKLKPLESKIQIDLIKTQKHQLENSYDRYVDSLDVYRNGLSEEEKIILRMARRFGECEINMPDGFVQEVTTYIRNWQSGQRLANVIARAKRKRYIPAIVRAMAEQELPAQFLYLAIQESNLDQRAVGPPTRFGIAKGMWQFIPTTGEKYGLRIGPLKDEASVDLLDERHDFLKSTAAAARYLRDIYTTDAQASGLLVMASYNWGEQRVLDLIRSLPANPKDRNFWKLISSYRHKIPEETYDYVFSIFSAAVIGENPPLFGFDFDNPLSQAN
jgi:membrane-bound lytic murein transglycosylase D